MRTHAVNTSPSRRAETASQQRVPWVLGWRVGHGVALWPQRCLMLSCTDTAAAGGGWKRSVPSSVHRLPPPPAEKTAQLGPWLPEPLPKALPVQSPSLRSWHRPPKPCVPQRGRERKTLGPKRRVPSQSSVFPQDSLFLLYFCPWDPAA